LFREFRHFLPTVLAPDFNIYPIGIQRNWRIPNLRETRIISVKWSTILSDQGGHSNYSVESGEHMKNLQALFVAAATVVLASASHAGISTTGQADPTVINASGTIAKYVNFTTIDTTVEFPLGDPTYVGTASSAGGYGASISVDSNTHLSLVVTNGDNMSTNEGGSVDTLPTTFTLRVGGREVRDGVVPGAGAVLASNSFLELAPSGPNAVTSLNYAHGYNSWVTLDATVTRSGVDDHFGAYSTSASLVWADLN
jgi:hypothetical protein